MRLHPGHFIVHVGGRLCRIDLEPSRRGGTELVAHMPKLGFNVAWVQRDGRFDLFNHLSAERKIRQALQALAADVKGAGELYAKKTGRCCVCGRLLTATSSVSSGIGPICARRL